MSNEMFPNLNDFEITYSTIRLHQFLWFLEIFWDMFLCHNERRFGFEVEGKKKIYFWPPEDESYLYISPPSESGDLYDLDTYYKASKLDPHDPDVLWK